MRVLSLPYRASILVFLISFVLFFWAKWNQFPTNIHAWTQSDRIALSYCFVDNGLNVLKPCTYDLGTKEGVTPAGLPIIEFLAAVVMKVFGKSLWILQVVHMLFFALGLYFLERLCRLLKVEEIGRLGVLGLFAFSPSLIYYADGVLPSVPSLSLFFGAFLFYLLSKEKPGSKLLPIFSGLLFFLAICNRWTYFLPVFAILAAQLFLTYSKKESFKLKPLLTLALPLFLSFLYCMHDRSLANEYGSAFLSSRMMVNNLEDFVEILERSFANWSGHWLSRIQVLWLLLLITTSMWQAKKLTARHQLLEYLVPLSFVAGFAYTIVMARQFEHHDYYFIDAYFPSLLLAGMSYYPIFREKHEWLKKWFGILTGVCFIFWVLQAKEVEAKRDASGLWNKVETTYTDFLGAADFLHQEGVAKDAVLLIPNSFTTNIPHLLTERKGFALVNTDSQRLDSVLSLDYDYALIQNRHIQKEVLEVYPSIVNRLERISDNGFLSLYRKSNTTSSAAAFLGLDTAPKATVTFEDAQATEEFAFNRDFEKAQGNRAWITFDLKSNEEADVSLWVVRGEDRWRYDVALGLDTAKSNEIYCSWPQYEGECGIYIYNPNKAELDLSNQSIVIY